MPVFILEKSKKKARDAWQHLGKSVPPWEIPPGAGPGHPKWSKGSPRQRLGHKSLHKSLWDLLGKLGKRGKTSAKPCCDEGFVSTGLELGATSGFPVCCGDPSVHPQPERGPGWLEQDRQGQEGSQGHCHTSPGTGSSRGTAPRSLSAPTPPWLPSTATGTFPWAAGSSCTEPRTAPSHVLTLCQHQGSSCCSQGTPGARGGAEHSSLAQAGSRQNPAGSKSRREPWGCHSVTSSPGRA